MKKKLALVMALVLVFTMSFGLNQTAIADVSDLPGTIVKVEKNPEDSDGVGPGVFSSSGSNVIAFKQGTNVYIWLDSSISSEFTSSAAKTALEEWISTLDPGLAAASNYIYVYGDFDGTNQNGHGDFSVDFYPAIIGSSYTLSSGQFYLSGTISHYTRFLFTPTTEYAQLTVSKTLVNNSNDTSIDAMTFDIEVTFSNASGGLDAITAPVGAVMDPASIDASTTSVTFTVTLGDGDAVDFTGIPYDTTYIVDETETLSSSWTVGGEVTSAVTLDGSNEDDTVTVTNTYAPPPETAALTVEKTLVNNSSDTSIDAMTFDIEVAFSNASGGLDAITAPVGAVMDPASIDASTTSVTYTVTLGDGDAVDFTGIPYDTTYTVVETETLSSSWTVGGEVTSAITLDGSNEDDTVTVTNTYAPPPDTAALTVEKTLVNNSSDTSIDAMTFDIEVTFSNASGGLDAITAPVGAVMDPASIDASTTSVTFTVTLGDGDAVIFEDIPYGTTYVVDETTALSDAYWMVGGEVLSAVELNDTNTEPTVEVTNTYAAGDLTITKTITGIGSSSTEFMITVEFEGELSLDGIVATNATDEGGGVYTMMLQGGESATFTNIPMDTTYTVSESSTPSYWTLVSILPNADGMFSSNSDMSQTVTVTNDFYNPPQYGRLIVDKTVSGDGADADMKFDFTVTFPASYNNLSNSLGLTGTNGVYTFQLSANDAPVYFNNLPFGLTYTVAEGALPNHWAMGATNGLSGKISSSTTYTATINNIFSLPPEYGNLLVDKAVTGDDPDTTEQFEFTVTFVGDEIAMIDNNASLTGTDGVYVFMLAADDAPVMFTNIPLGTTYTVSEVVTTTQMDDGWAGDNPASGTIDATGTTNVTLTNDKAQGVLGETDDGGDGTDLPQTGGIALATLLGLTGAGFLMAGGASWLILRKKNRNTN